MKKLYTRAEYEALIKREAKKEKKEHPQLSETEARTIAEQHHEPQATDQALINKAKAIEKKRSPRSRKSDEKQHNKKTLPLTKENLEIWRKDPGSYDLEGIDTVKKLVRSFYRLKSKAEDKAPPEYSKKDLEAARRYLKDHNYLYEGTGKYIELQAEIAKAIAKGIDPAVFDYAAHLADDISLKESIKNEQEWELLEARGYN